MAFPSLKKSTAPVAAIEAGTHAATIRSIAYAGNHNLGDRGPTPCVVIEYVTQGEFGPTSVHRLYPWSIGVFNDLTTGERLPSALRAVIENVLPKEIADFDADDMADDFQIETLLGKPVTVGVEVKAGNNGGAFANIIGVTAAPEGQASALIDSPFMSSGEDRAAFRRLPDAIQAVCRRGGITL